MKFQVSPGSNTPAIEPPTSLTSGVFAPAASICSAEAPTTRPSRFEITVSKSATYHTSLYEIAFRLVMLTRAFATSGSSAIDPHDEVVVVVALTPIRDPTGNAG